MFEIGDDFFSYPRVEIRPRSVFFPAHFLNLHFRGRAYRDPSRRSGSRGNQGVRAPEGPQREWRTAKPLRVLPTPAGTSPETGAERGRPSSLNRRTIPGGSRSNRRELHKSALLGKALADKEVTGEGSIQ